MEKINVWRVQLKPAKTTDISYRDLLDYCLVREIIGVGWIAVKTRKEDTLYDDCARAYPNGVSSAYKAIHAISQMKTGDLVWTRLGEDASEYYLGRVGEKCWKECLINEADQKKYDIGHAVSVKWIKIGKQDMVPGKVANSFIPPATAQQVYDVTKTSISVWNKMSPQDYPKYDSVKLSIEDFWNDIDSEELECLVLLYLQHKGYYIYSSTIKGSTPKYEATMVYKDGSHRAYPQVKRNTYLNPSEYAKGIKKKDKVFLFTSSENYGAPVDNVVTISKTELEDFMTNYPDILPNPIQILLSNISG